MQDLQLDRVPLIGSSLIEASAGTGKTFAISQLVLRLVLQAQPGFKDRALNINEILVVTFTKAATQELKDRIRLNMNAALHYLSLPKDDAKNQDIVATIVDAACEESDKSTVYTRLREALLYLDDAPIFTIHGFCQRILADYSFLTGQPSQQTLLENNREIILDACQELWRACVYPADIAEVRYFTSLFKSPDDISSKLSRALDADLVDASHNENIIKPEDVFLQLQALLADFSQTYQLAVEYWHGEKQSIQALFGEGMGRSFTKKNLPVWLDALDDYFNDATYQLSGFDQCARFGQSQINQKIPKEPPQHPLFDLIDTLNEIIERLKPQLLSGVRQALLALIVKKQQEKNVLFFDDLVKRLSHVLGSDTAVSLQLKQALRASYPAALIDEFQDTDQWQYQIFAQIYQPQDLCCLMIGDPKQAIYSFRGADINSYFLARNAVDDKKRYTLATNYRSHPSLVKNINALFSHNKKAFCIEGFPEYPQVNSPASFADKQALTLSEADELTNCNFSVIRLSGDSKTLVDISRSEAADKTAQYIQQLLLHQTLINNKAIVPADIAILVRSGTQANIMQQALSKAGVNSVYLAKDSVLSSSQASEFLKVLQAIADPLDSTFMCAALACELIAYSGDDIFALQQQLTELHKLQLIFRSAYECWQDKGFICMWQQFMADFLIAETLLASSLGERKLTNLNQLSEIFQHLDDSVSTPLQKVEALQGLIHDAVDNDEFQKLRLETEANLVNIITIHKSKGLEYPLVCCPFLFDASSGGSDIFTTVFNAQTQQRELHWQASSEVKKQYAVANFAEDIRLLYVALTRAAYHFSCCWGPVKGIEKTALYHLLYDRNTALKDLDETRFWQCLSNLDGFIFDPQESFSAVTQKEEVTATKKGHCLEKRIFSSSVKPAYVARSYSSILNATPYDAEVKDRDEQAEQKVVLPMPAFSANIFHFPKGSDAGNFMHQVLEDVDFQDPSIDLPNILNTQLQRFGFDDGMWSPILTTYFKQLLGISLSPLSCSLSSIKSQSLCKEMGFYLQAHENRGDVFKALLVQYREDLGIQKGLEHLSVDMVFNDVKGFFKGFIDLVFEDNGEYFVLDYKSNFLGFESCDYNLQAMHFAIEEHYYDLQYLIYVAALQRYLKQRLPNYNYQQHIGGVFYLFLRGMVPDNSTGIYYVKPPQAIIDALENIFIDHHYDTPSYVNEVCHD